MHENISIGTSVLMLIILFILLACYVLIRRDVKPCTYGYGTGKCTAEEMEKYCTQSKHNKEVCDAYCRVIIEQDETIFAESDYCTGIGTYLRGALEYRNRYGDFKTPIKIRRK